MQTFLPFPDFKLSAQALDNRRLGKQRVECFQLHNAITGETAWSSHPAAKMWSGYEDALILYGLEICKEWIKRGFKDTMLGKLDSLYYGNRVMPPWLGDERLHQSHRSNLIRKDPWHYMLGLGWKDPPNLPYFWPGVDYVAPNSSLTESVKGIDAQTDNGA